MLDTKTYWENRLEDEKGLKSVGCIRFSSSYNNWLYKAKQECLEDVLETFNVEPKTILDIGSGTGFFIDYYKKKFNSEITGLEITKIGAKRLTNNFPFAQIICQDISSSNLNLGKSFDLVNVFDIIYHILDDKLFVNAIGNISKHINSNGYLILTDNFRTTTNQGKHVHHRAIEDYKKIFQQNNIQILGVFPIYYFLNREYIKRVGPPIISQFGKIFYSLDQKLRTNNFQHGSNMKLMIAIKH